MLPDLSFTFLSYFFHNKPGLAVALRCLHLRKTRRLGIAWPPNLFLPLNPALLLNARLPCCIWRQKASGKKWSLRQRGRVTRWMHVFRQKKRERELDVSEPMIQNDVVSGAMFARLKQQTSRQRLRQTRVPQTTREANRHLDSPSPTVMSHVACFRKQRLGYSMSVLSSGCCLLLCVSLDAGFLLRSSLLHHLT